jgi:16S rRNA (cytidine1402-2'-O)-methyltransferase
MAGTLYVVATPIGNLGDVTRRAVETLSAATRIAAEDTRRTRALLSHLGITGKPVVALDANASEGALRAVVDDLVRGETVALVTDAGTPSVSDPGTALVRAAVAADVRVVAIPGPSAVTAAVAVSGLVDGPFTFLGFLPRHGEKRREALRRIERATEPVVLFEAPGRTQATLEELAARMPERQACVARELTKIHEEARRGALLELSRAGIEPRGEVTLVIAGADPRQTESEGSAGDVDALIRERLAQGDSPRTVASDVSELTGAPRREVYSRVLALRRALDPPRE